MTEPKSIYPIITGLFAGYHQYCPETWLRSYAGKLCRYSIATISQAVERWDHPDKPPTAHRLVQLCDDCEREHRYGLDDTAEQLRAHPLYRTIPQPRPYGYPSDAHLARRGPDRIAVYNAIARGDEAEAQRLSMERLRTENAAELESDVSDANIDEAVRQMEHLGLRIPPHIDLVACAQAYWRGVRSVRVGVT